jgi:hypothetical protein
MNNAYCLDLQRTNKIQGIRFREKGLAQRSKTFLSKARLRGYKEILTGTYLEPESKDVKSKKDF